MKLRADIGEAMTQTQSVATRIAEYHDEHRQAIEVLGQVAEEQAKQLDTTLRGHVVEEVTRMNARIDALTQTASTSGAAAGAAVRHERITADLMRLEVIQWNALPYLRGRFPRPDMSLNPG